MDDSAFKMDNLAFSCPVCSELVRCDEYFATTTRGGDSACWHGPVRTQDLMLRVIQLEQRVKDLESHQSGGES